MEKRFPRYCPTEDKEVLLVVDYSINTRSLEDLYDTYTKGLIQYCSGNNGNSNCTSCPLHKTLPDSIRC